MTSSLLWPNPLCHSASDSLCFAGYADSRCACRLFSATKYALTSLELMLHSWCKLFSSCLCFLSVTVYIYLLTLSLNVQHYDKVSKNNKPKSRYFGLMGSVSVTIDSVRWMIGEYTYPHKRQNYEGCKPEGTVEVIFTTLSEKQNAKVLAFHKYSSCSVKQFL